LLLALHCLTATDGSGEREWSAYGEIGHALPFTEAAVLRYARFGDEALYRYRLDLARWGFLRYRQQPGHPSLYDIVTIEDEMDVEEFFPVPAMISDDDTLKPGHLAAYLVLAHAAEQRRLDELPDNIGDLDGWEFASYGHRCDLRGRDLDRAAGFRHSTTRNRYLDDLVRIGHLIVLQRGRQQQPTAYRLLTNEAADEAQRAFYRTQHERWLQQQESGELEHQPGEAT
jgi:hypothetical protein